MLITLIKIAILLGAIMTAAAYLVLVERWIAAWVQDRRGPNRVGIPLTKIRLFGLGQPIADGLKMIFKEEYTPGHVDRRLYVLAPLVIMTAALAVFSVIPVGSVLPAIPALGLHEPIPLMVAPHIDVGMILVFALSSIAVYGVILAGWSSNSKYSFLGAMRSSAQMISYELPLGLGILSVVVACHSLRLDDVIRAQADSGVWFALAQPLGFVVFSIAAFAEAGRLPFDLTECEQELVAGYHTEYAGVKLVLFLTAEFIHMITAAFLMVIMFLGGWHFWGITGAHEDIGWGLALLRVVVLLTKVLAVVLLFMLIRWSWPRFRFDQLMSFAWKILLPLGVLNLVAVSIFSELQHPQVLGNWLTGRLGNAGVALLFCVAGWAVAAVGLWFVSVAQPIVADNRPRLDIDIHGIDRQLDFESPTSS